MISSTLHDLFFTQAARTPDAPAVVTGSAQLTFGELALRALRLSSELRRRSFGPEALIGVCVGRSPDLPACLLGVLRAGYAFLPLDPSQPPERSAQILADARPALVIVDEPGYRRLSTVCCGMGKIDDLLGSVGNQLPGSVSSEVRSDCLAYVIYTSGSTGTPKGVEITHDAVVNTILAINNLCEVGPRDRLLNVSPTSFDLSVYDFFGAWAAGAAVVLIGDTAYPEPRDWVSLMGRTNVTVWNSAPALLGMLLDVLERDPEAAAPCLRHLRIAMLSGDRITLHLLHHLLQLKPGARILAMGGATEASIWSVHNWVEALPPDSRYVPYGSALPNQTVIVLDPQLNEVPVGETGHLYIGGVGLARGYRGRADLTSAAFIPDPRTRAARLYSTGDQVRRLQDGNMEFLGRDDGQVKIRGFRVEIGEVERALLAIDGIEQAAVTHHPSARGAHLCAHLVARHENGRWESATLRELLSTRLPAYMMPERFHFLARLPVTPNGKVDRTQLFDCDTVAASCAGAMQDVAPIRTGGHTKTVRAAWQEVLRLTQIDPSEHFLDLGGNSLLASQIINRLCESLQIEMTVGDLFENPTLTGFAALVAERLVAPGRAGDAAVPHD
jgi:amino acid adenylation domain-containing protein